MELPHSQQITNVARVVCSSDNWCLRSKKSFAVGVYRQELKRIQNCCAQLTQRRKAKQPCLGRVVRLRLVRGRIRKVHPDVCTAALAVEINMHLAPGKGARWAELDS